MPVCVGLKTTLMEQLDFAARLDVQVVEETLNSPVVEIEIPVSETLCLLDSLNVLAALVDPTAVAGNFALAGVNVTPAIPVPESGTCCGLLGALSVRVMSPVRAPSSVGVNVTLIVQLEPAFSVAPQVVELMAKSPLATMLLMSRVAVPLFLTVTVFAADVPPTVSFPKVNEVGVRTTAGTCAAVILSAIVVELLKVPDTPDTVIVEVPVGVPAGTVMVSVLVMLVGFGLNPAVTPLGIPVALRVTLPLKPSKSLTVIVLVPLLPC